MRVFLCALLACRRALCLTAWCCGPSQKTSKTKTNKKDQVVLVAMKEKKKQKYMYIMDLQNFDAVPEVVKGKEIGIKMVANGAGQRVGDDQFNGTFIFRNTKQRTAWLSPLHEAKQRLTPTGGRGGCRWHLRTFGKGVRCSNCQLLMWGLVSQGYTCMNDGCTQQVHAHCLALCTSACVASNPATVERQVTVRDRPAQRQVTQRRKEGGGDAAAAAAAAGPARTDLVHTGAHAGGGLPQRIAGRRSSAHTAPAVAAATVPALTVSAVPYEGYEQQVTQKEGSWQPGESVVATNDGRGFRKDELLVLVGKAAGAGAFWVARNAGGQDVTILPMDAQLLDRRAPFGGRPTSLRGASAAGGGPKKDYMNIPSKGAGGLLPRGARDYINLPKGGLPTAAGGGGGGGSNRDSRGSNRDSRDYVNLGNMATSQAGADEREHAMDLWYVTSRLSPSTSLFVHSRIMMVGKRGFRNRIRGTPTVSTRSGS